MAGRRDLAAGLVRPRPGPARASRRLTRSAGLALRLQRVSLAAWTAGLLLLGAAFGSLLGDVEDFLADNPQLQDVFGVDDDAILESFLDTVMRMLSLLATAGALTVALQPRKEENAGRAEPLLATAISRARWAGSHVVVAMGGATGVMLTAAAGVGVAAAIERRDVSWLADLLGAGLGQLPAIWLTIGVVVALYGISSRAAPWGWGVLAYAAFVGLLGDALDLPADVRAASPFHHTPELPGGEIDLVALSALMTFAVALIAVGLALFRRRDLSLT